jgi:dTDP-L-rhamnose 4-epimerase
LRILVTGGAGFIGSHLVDRLIEIGHDVTALDNLESQVHDRQPDYMNPKATYVFGNLKDDIERREALEDAEVVFHLAALVGVGQSMYDIARYTDTNTVGTAVLLEDILKSKTVKKLVVASSMSVYGEGSYKCENCGVIHPPLRPEEQLRQAQWEMKCHSCNKISSPVPTNEQKPLSPTSVYAVTKRTQEELCLSVGRAYGLPTVALRYFNVYGPRQSLSNPYTGVAAIFSSRIKSKSPLIVFEDGLQTRDFISVHDIVDASILVMENSRADYEAFNVGTGRPLSIVDVANTLVALYGSKAKPKITHEFRAGDIRHCFADMTKIRKLGFSPSVSFENGMRELAQWGGAVKSTDKVDTALGELRERNLIKG